MEQETYCKKRRRSSPKFAKEMTSRAGDLVKIIAARG